MTRKLCVTTLALALAGGVYLTAQPAAASNMGFKLERDFQPVDGFLNEFFVSMPLFNGLGDTACTSGTNGAGENCDSLPNKCVNGAGSAPTEGDGIINADDFLCDVYDGNGLLTVSAYDIDTCSFLPRGIRLNPLGPGYIFVQTWTGELPVDESLRVNAQFVSGAQHPAVIVGSHNPSFAGKLIAPNASCSADRQLELINLPYHTMYQNAAEILCGLIPDHWERDPTTGAPIWKDIDGDGTDDPCGVLSGGGEPVGIFDGNNTITVSWFDNVDDNSGPTGEDTDNANIPCRVRRNPLGAGVLFPFGDACFDLIPGEGYLVLMSTTHNQTRYLSPHF